MKKQIKIVLALIIIISLLSGTVLASSESIYIGVLKAISFGQHTLYGDDEGDIDDEEIVDGDEEWSRGYDAGLEAVTAGEPISVPERR